MLRIRQFQPEDAYRLWEIFYTAIHQGTTRFYNAAQRDAWAGSRRMPDNWSDRLAKHITKVAVRDSATVGFMTLGRDGHLDLAFIAPEAMGTNVAAALHDALLHDALLLGLTRLDTEASHLARRFFLKQGWQEICEQTVERRGVALTNFRMEKRL
ncbi:GNAT family N-acetyltransferase [Qingshengfaniella alkalisoli]|uniref:GNAT family N-acetyltransferase n=1 Tax=Qingshengfaniella alkalisoli TaxID=2599296 RepID=A0A5B8IVE8_9RHOB|nr:GNAT family N-acetyltransferase [Qingshengfaniella alkalisoli]QDY69423.1 GNAT family N-acetyltransferase [Qingshengfaniella alkalisoli]